MTAPTLRDMDSHVRYLYRKTSLPAPAPWELKEPDPWVADNTYSAKVAERRLVRVTDCRTAASAFDLDTHGLVLANPPPHAADLDFTDNKVTEGEYGPQVVELAKRMTGADKGFLYQYLVRGKDDGALDFHVHYAHSDYSPQSIPTLRKDLVERFGLPAEEAKDCDLCMLNMWHPRTWPAWTEPLALLDWSSLEELQRQKLDPVIFSREDGLKLSPRTTPHTKAYLKLDNKRTGANTLRGRFSDKDDEATRMRPESRRPLAERLAEDTFINGPTYSPSHRWVFCSDMRPDEALFFKQIDTRDGVAKVSYHNAVRDPFHEADDPERPFRRSLELRVLLTFPKKTAASKL